ncbi:MAG: mechanosensitive ion channel family protein [Ignavibacteria bacterium]|nr:mechanosensitive ion channel family protein [Ignavibacteria bacterium]
MDLNTIWAQIESEIVKYGLMVVVALVFWIVGRWLINLFVKVIRKALKARSLDPTLQQYVASITSVSFNILLIIAILSQFGINTTSFAALVAATGFAVGTAWGGLLAHFAAGAFLLILRPFKVGDFIVAAGTSGTVEVIGLFTTTLVTADGIRTYVGNNKIFSDNIQNLSSETIRRVDRLMQLAHNANIDDVINRLKSRLEATPGVLKTPPPEVWVIDLTPSGPILAIRPYCNPADYWNVYAATNDVIRTVAESVSLPPS